MVLPNIVFIVLDTLRADRTLEFHKNIFLTPYLKSLINNSIYFENCIANSPWTIPSHINMFTGLYHTQTALIENETDKITNKIPILSEILKDMGYQTMCFSENPFISNTYGLTRGFDYIFNIWDFNPWIREKYPLSRIIVFLGKIKTILKSRDNSILLLKILEKIRDKIEKIIKKVIGTIFLKILIFKLKNNTLRELDKFYETIKREIDKPPFYFFFNFLTVHDPYIPIKETFKLLDINFKDFKIIRELLINPLKFRFDVDIKSKRISQLKINTMKKLYDACVLSSDLVINKCFSIFEKLDLLENTYFIITSDHGEHLCDKSDHYLWEHSTYLSVYEPLIRVPLIIYNKNFERKIVKNQVQLIDLFHTILHLTSIPISKNKYLQIKKSIIHQIKNNSTPQYIFGEFFKTKNEMYELINEHRRTINPNLILKVFNHLYFLRSDKYKYIKYNNLDNEEFYDLSIDPYEQNNIFEENNEKCKEMKTFLGNLLSAISNGEQLKVKITQKEKYNIKKVIDRLKIKEL